MYDTVASRVSRVSLAFKLGVSSRVSAVLSEFTVISFADHHHEDPESSTVPSQYVVLYLFILIDSTVLYGIKGKVTYI